MRMLLAAQRREAERRERDLRRIHSTPGHDRTLGRDEGIDLHWSLAILTG